MALRQVCYNVLVPGTGPYSSGWPGFNTNLLTSGTKATKVSIEAPPGTVVEINNKTIVIGQSGIYDFSNEDIIITSIKFPQPIVYTRGSVDPSKKAALETILDGIQDQIEALGEIDLSSDTAYTNFCNTGELIYMGGASGYDYSYSGKTLHGFQDVLYEYLSVMQGDLIETTGDLQNVIVNYTYSN